MFSKFATRREFLNFGKLSILFLLNSCSNNPNKVRVALQNSFYPQTFKDTIPKDWKLPIFWNCIFKSLWIKRIL